MGYGLEVGKWHVEGKGDGIWTAPLLCPEGKIYFCLFVSCLLNDVGYFER